MSRDDFDKHGLVFTNNGTDALRCRAAAVRMFLNSDVKTVQNPEWRLGKLRIHQKLVAKAGGEWIWKFWKYQPLLLGYLEENPGEWDKAWEVPGAHPQQPRMVLTGTAESESGESLPREAKSKPKPRTASAGTTKPRPATPGTKKQGSDPKGESEKGRYDREVKDLNLAAKGAEVVQKIPEVLRQSGKPGVVPTKNKKGAGTAAGSVDSPEPRGEAPRKRLGSGDEGKSKKKKRTGGSPRDRPRAGGNEGQSREERPREAKDRTNIDLEKHIIYKAGLTGRPVPAPAPKRDQRKGRGPGHQSSDESSQGSTDTAGLTHVATASTSHPPTEEMDEDPGNSRGSGMDQDDDEEESSPDMEDVDDKIKDPDFEAARIE